MWVGDCFYRVQTFNLPPSPHRPTEPRARPD